MTAKVLFLDIETYAMVTESWRLWNNDVQPSQVLKDWHILSYAARWLGSKTWHYSDQRNTKWGNDRPLLAKLWQLMDEADVIVAHNGKKFDVRKINARFIVHGFLPPSPYKVFDTLTVSKKHFAFSSHRLAFIADVLKLRDQKGSVKEKLSENKRTLKAWKELETYNKQDVIVLEQVYEKLAPWEKTLDLAIYKDGVVVGCRTCGGENFNYRGFEYSIGRKVRKKVCKDCGTWHSDKLNLRKKEEKPTISRI